MSKYQFPTLKDEKEFESLVNDLCKKHYGIEFQVYGRKGQKQYGIDGLSFSKDKKKIVFQCKNKFINGDDKKIQEALLKDIENEVKSTSEKFTNVDTFIFANSFKQDTILQDKARDLSRQYSFTIIVWSWEVIEGLLEKYPDVAKQYYPKLFDKTIKDEPLARNSRRKFLIGLTSIPGVIGLISISGVIIWLIMNTKFLSQKIKRFLFQYLPNGNQLVINKKSGTIHHKIICKNHLPKKNNVGNNIDFIKNVKFHKSKKLQILNKLTENISIEDSIEILLLAISNDPTSVHLYDKLIKLYGEIKRYGEIHSLLSNAEIIISNKIKMLKIELSDCLNKTKEYKRYNKALMHIKLQQSKALDRARYKVLNV